MGSVQNAQVHSKTSDQGSASRQSVNQHNQLLQRDAMQFPCSEFGPCQYSSVLVRHTFVSAHWCVGTGNALCSLPPQHCSAAQLLGGKPGQCLGHAFHAAKCTAPEAPCNFPRRVGWAARSSHPKRSKGQLSLMQVEVSSTPSPRAGDCRNFKGS